jgi:hypothetical protein
MAAIYNALRLNASFELLDPEVLVFGQGERLQLDRAVLRNNPRVDVPGGGGQPDLAHGEA